MESDYYQAHSTLGSIYLGQEKFANAAGSFKKVLELSPKNYNAAYNYAIAIQSKDPESYDSNIAAWNQFIKIAKNNARVPKQMMATAEETIKALNEAKGTSGMQ